MVAANGTACIDMHPVYKMKSVQMDNRMQLHNNEKNCY